MILINIENTQRVIVFYNDKSKFYHRDNVIAYGRFSYDEKNLWYCLDILNEKHGFFKIYGDWFCMLSLFLLITVLLAEVLSYLFTLMIGNIFANKFGNLQFVKLVIITISIVVFLVFFTYWY